MVKAMFVTKIKSVLAVGLVAGWPSLVRRG